MILPGRYTQVVIMRRLKFTLVRFSTLMQNFQRKHVTGLLVVQSITILVLGSVALDKGDIKGAAENLIASKNQTQAIARK